MLINVIIYSFLAGFSTVLGVYLVRRFENWVKKNIISLISFAIGVLLATAFFHLLPESINLNPDKWFYWTLGSIIFLYLMEHSIIIHSCREEKYEVHSLGIVSLFGLGFHSLIDGIIIGASFGISFNLGLLASLAVIFHEVAEGTFTYTLLINDNVTRKKALFYSWMVALATPFGAILTFLFIKNISLEIIGLLLAIAAGSFIYIGTSDLIPETHRKYSLLNMFLVILGIVFVYIVGQLGNLSNICC